VLLHQIKNRYIVMRLKFFSFICLLILNISLFAQSLTIKDFPQLFLPSLSVGAEGTLPRPVKSAESVTYYSLGGGIQANVPISGKIELDLNLDKLKNWKNIKNWKDIENIGKALPVDVSGYQLFWTVNGGLCNTQLTMSGDSTAHLGYYFHTGVSGLHLQKKFRLLFYQATLGFSEDKNTMSQLKPVFSAYMGQARIIKYGFILYYGGYINYTDGALLPIPFVGIYTALPPFFDLQVTLPLQARLSYRKHKTLRASAEIAFSGFQTGYAALDPLTNDYERYRLRSSHLKIATTAEHRTEGGRLSFEVGTVVARSAKLSQGSTNIADYTPKGGIYMSVNYQATLGRKSLIKTVWDKLEFKW
jgi:hypothetical protein